jgi:hypothetical protein
VSFAQALASVKPARVKSQPAPPYDKPGLDEEFRAWQRAYGDAAPTSLRQLNEIAQRFGTVYKTLD